MLKTRENSNNIQDCEITLTGMTLLKKNKHGTVNV